MHLTYYGHSSFAVTTNDKTLLFDPFITPNQAAKHIDISSIKTDYVLLSHGHGDHVADAAAIAKNNDATVIAIFAVTDWISKEGVQNTQSMNIGGKRTFDFGTVKCVNAVHSSLLPDGTYGGSPMGFLISADKNFYYSGDTALTMDMQLIPRWAKLDFAVLCIGDNYTMGFEDAIEAARMLECTEIVGVHYDTFDDIKIDQHTAKKTFAAAGMNLHLPAIGESINF